MAQRNDDELAFYLAELSNPNGQISDQERLWYLTELNIAQPYLGATQMNDLWTAYWLTKGIPQGSVNDMAYNWLVSLGIPARHINDMWHDYFDSVIAYPPVLDTALVWSDESTLLISGQDITGWNNKGTGGAAYDLIGETSGSVLPQLSSQNGISCLELSLIANTDRKWLRPASGLFIPQPFTIIVVANLDLVATTQRVLFDGFAGGTRSYLQSDDFFREFSFHGGIPINAGANSEDLLPHVFTCIGDGATSALHISDVFDGIDVDSGINGITYITVGSNFNTFTSWSGRIYEILVFDYSISNSDYLSIQSFMRDKWGF